MKRFKGVLLFVVLTIAPCFAHHLAVIVAKDNNVESVTSARLARMFKGEEKKWTDGKNVILVLRRDSLTQTETLEQLNKMSETEVKTFLTTHPESVQFANTDAELLKIVETVPGAIGLLDVHSINDKIRVLKVDGKLPLEDGYLPHHH